MRRDNQALADAISLNREVRGGVKKLMVIYRQFEKMSPAALLDAAREFKERYGYDLHRYLSGILPDGAPKDRALAHLEGDQVKAYAALLRCRILGHQGDWIGGPFESGDAAARNEIVQAYNTFYQSDLWADLKRAVRKTDFELMESFITDGEIAPAELLHHCMVGIGTDELGIKKVLKDRTHEEVEEIKADYARRYKYRSGEGRDLVKDIKSESSGDSLYDTLEYLNGIPQTMEDLHTRVQARHRFERSGSLIRRLDIFTSEGKVMDRDVQIADRYYQENIAGKSPSHREKQRFQTLAEIAEIDFDSFREIKVWAANTVANMAAGSAAGLTTFTCLKLGVPLVFVVMAAGAASMSTRSLLKINIKGGSYGRKEVIRDTLLAAIDGGTLFMSKALTNVLAQKVLSFMTKFGLKQAVSLSSYIDRRQTASRLISHQHDDAASETAPCLSTVLKNQMRGVAAAPQWQNETDARFERMWQPAISATSHQNSDELN